MTKALAAYAPNALYDGPFVLAKPAKTIDRAVKALVARSTAGTLAAMADAWQDCRK